MKKLVVFLYCIAALLLFLIVVKKHQIAIIDKPVSTTGETNTIAEKSSDGITPDATLADTKTAPIVEPTADETTSNTTAIEAEIVPSVEPSTCETTSEGVTTDEDTASTAEKTPNDIPPATSESAGETIPTTVPESENNTPDVEM